VGTQAIDAPFPHRLREVAGTHADAPAAKALGFSGKLVFHPGRIVPVNAAHAAAVARGEAVALVDGEFMAMDLVPRMERIIAPAREAAAA